MRLVDANILMYASFDAFPQHEKAKKWLDGALNPAGADPIKAFIIKGFGIA